MELVVISKGESRTLELSAGESIFTCLLREGLIAMATCGGRGTCGRCSVLLLEGELSVKPKDRMFFSRRELEQGYRLACTARPEGRCVIRTAFRDGDAQGGGLKIVAGRPGEGAGPGRGSREASDSGNAPGGEKALAGRGEPGGAADFIAADLGTTTLAMELIDGGDGSVKGVYRAMNPQRVYGADVVSRIQADVEGHGAKLRGLIAEELRKGYEELARGRKPAQERGSKGEESGGKPDRIIVSGNTTMAHLLLGLSCRGLSRAPFTPETLSFAEAFGMPCKTLVLPGASAFVGGDILSGLYALSFAEREKCALFIDLGTNGEMALGGREGIVATATAAGPAFEGGFTASLPGSDMIRLVSGLLARGFLDETGLLGRPYFERGYPVVTRDGRRALLTQQDVRDLQMAKAAVRAGIEILLGEAGIREEQVEKIFLAGGFGYFLDPAAAVRIGLIPPGLADRTKAVGNTSLEGAVRFGLDEGIGREAFDRLKKITRVINLAETPGFNDLYVGRLNLAP